MDLEWHYDFVIDDDVKEEQMQSAVTEDHKTVVRDDSCDGESHPAAGVPTVAAEEGLEDPVSCNEVSASAVIKSSALAEVESVVKEQTAVSDGIAPVPTHPQQEESAASTGQCKRGQTEKKTQDKKSCGMIQVCLQLLRLLHPWRHCDGS